MLDETDEHTWVSIDVLCPGAQGGTRSLRGRISTSDLESVFAGSFRRAFVRLDDTHWTEEIWDSRLEQKAIRTTVVGRDGRYTNFVGTYYVLANQILFIGIMKDHGRRLRED